MKVSELFDYTEAYRLLEDEGGGGDSTSDSGGPTVPDNTGPNETPTPPTIPPHTHSYVPFRLFGPNGLLYMLAYAQMLANRRDFRIGQAIRKSKRKFKAPAALDNKYFRAGFKSPNKIPKFDF